MATFEYRMAFVKTWSAIADDCEMAWEDARYRPTLDDIVEVTIDRVDEYGSMDPDERKAWSILPYEEKVALGREYLAVYV